MIGIEVMLFSQIISYFQCALLLWSLRRLRRSKIEYNKMEPYLPIQGWVDKRRDGTSCALVSSHSALVLVIRTFRTEFVAHVLFKKKQLRLCAHVCVFTRGAKH